MVAPYMGAWIETLPVGVQAWGAKLSHPTWVRGLKHRMYRIPCIEKGVAPLHGCVD